MARLRFLALLAALLLPASAAADGDPVIAKVNHLVLKRQYAASATLLRDAATAGNAAAQFRLGVIYSLGIGVDQDDGLAKYWLARAASGGEPRAARLLSRLISGTPPPTGAVRPPVIGNAAAWHPPVTVEARDLAGNGWLERAAARGLAREIAALPGVKSVVGAAPQGDVALNLAARRGHGEAVNTLLQLGAPINGVDGRGRTALMNAGASGDAALSQSLIAAGADVSLADRDGATALSFAIRRCDLPDAIGLIRHKAPMASDAAGNSPLHLALEYCRLEPLTALLATTQDADAADARGRTPLWYAAWLGDGAAIASLLAAKARTDVVDTDGLAPLHAAAMAGQAAAIVRLLAGGADANALTAAGDTALALAAASRCQACMPPLIDATHGLDSRNRFGDTALIAATRAGEPGIVAMLMSAGANPRIRNQARDTAVTIAKRLGDPKIVKSLVEQRS